MNNATDPAQSASGQEYQCPSADQVFEHEIEIKRSRFICLIGRAANEAQAREFIDAARRRFPDARHHCSAFLCEVEDSNRIERSSDDGEPSGTAGKPMLDVLKGSGMSDIVAVVVRYFGGIKLGAGGLVHAYSQAVGDALADVTRVTRSRKDLFAVRVAHDAAGRLEAELRGRGFHVLGSEYGADVTMTVSAEPGSLEALDSQLAALTQGRVAAKKVGQDWVETPAR